MIRPLINFETSFTFNFIFSNSSESKYSISFAKYNCERNSPAEAFAIYKKRINSFVVSLSKPSAIFEDIETLERLI